jgi:hypothetical protein
MMGFQINEHFSADGVISERSRAGRIFHIRRNRVGSGMILTAVARYFVWQPEFVEGYHRHWRVDCFVQRHVLAPEPMPLGEALVNALIRERLCDEPIWLSVHRCDDEKGKAYGKVFEDD